MQIKPIRDECTTNRNSIGLGLLLNITDKKLQLLCLTFETIKKN